MQIRTKNNFQSPLTFNQSYKHILIGKTPFKVSRFWLEKLHSSKMKNVVAHCDEWLLTA